MFSIKAKNRPYQPNCEPAIKCLKYPHGALVDPRYFIAIFKAMKSLFQFEPKKQICFRLCNTNIMICLVSCVQVLQNTIVNPFQLLRFTVTNMFCDKRANC